MQIKEFDCITINPSPLIPIAEREEIDYLDTSSVTEGRLEKVQHLISDFPSRAQREVAANDILISSVRPNLHHYYYVKDAEDGMIASSGFIHLRVNDTATIDPKFLYYYLTSPFYTNYYTAIADCSQSSYPSFNKDVIEDIAFPNVSIERQRRIAKVLSAIDDKIALNRKKIEKLEALAKTIYDYWFVQFDFPDANGRPYKSSGGKMVWNEQLKREVPDGWNACHIGDLCNCHDSLRVPLSGKQRAEMQGGVPYYGATGIMDYVNGHIFDGEFLLLAEDGTVMTEEGFPILQIINGKTWVNNHAHVLSPRIECSVKFLQLHFRNIPVRKIKTGSIQPKITKNNLFAFRVLLIPTLILEQADKFFSFLQKRIETSVKSNERLLWLRAFLLPLLMNGQVEVGE